MQTQNRTALAVAVTISSVACLMVVTGCSSPDFQVNPPISPTALATPTEIPTATPAPTSTPVPLPAYAGDMLTTSLGLLQNHDKFSVRGTLRLPVLTTPTPDGAAPGDPPVLETVDVEGEYRAPINLGGSGITITRDDQPGLAFVAPSNTIIIAPPSFELNFSRPGSGSPGTKVEVQNGQIASNTTGGDIEPETDDSRLLPGTTGPAIDVPGIAMFLTVALSEGRFVEYDLQRLGRFDPADIRFSPEFDPNEVEAYVIDAVRTNSAGDAESWRFWLRLDRRLERVELEITNEDDPSREVYGALQIEGYGDCLGRLCSTLDD